MESILVTGCAGFIGSAVCQHLLEQGFRLIGLDNLHPFYDPNLKIRNLASFKAHPEFHFHQIDIGDAEALKNIPSTFSACIHLAATPGVLPSVADPVGYFQNNLMGTATLLEFLRHRNCRKVLFASSSSVYEESGQALFEEDATGIAPPSPYGQSKLACEMLTQTWHRLYQFDVLNLRLFSVYGPAMRPDLAISKFTRQLYQDEPITIYGDGKSMRDYTYIQDIVQGISAGLHFLLHKEQVFETINLGGGEPVQLADLIRELEKLTGITAPKIYQNAKAAEMKFTGADLHKAKRLLNYQARTPIRQGLVHFHDWYREQANLPQGPAPYSHIS